MSGTKMPRAAALRTAMEYYRLLEVWCIEDGQIEQARQHRAEANRLLSLLELGIVPPEYAS